MDPFSIATGMVGLVSFALQLVTCALRKIDKTVTANEVAAELEKLQGNLEDLQAQMNDIHTTLKIVASNTTGLKSCFESMLRMVQPVSVGRY